MKILEGILNCTTK